MASFTGVRGAGCAGDARNATEKANPAKNDRLQYMEFMYTVYSECGYCAAI